MCEAWLFSEKETSEENTQLCFQNMPRAFCPGPATGTRRGD